MSWISCRTVGCLASLLLLPLIGRGQLIAVPGGPNVKPPAPVRAPTGEELSRQLMQLKAERQQLAAAHDKSDPRRVTVEKRLAAAQGEIAARNSPGNAAPAASTESADRGVQAMMPIFPRIVPMQITEISPANYWDAAANMKWQQGVTSEDTPVDAAARKALAGTPVFINGTLSLDDFLTMVREQSRCNIVPNWPALTASGIDRNTPLTLTLNSVSADRALALALNQVAGGAANLRYAVDGGIVMVSTADDLQSSKYQVVKTYAIRDIVSTSSLAGYPAYMQHQLYQDQVLGLQDVIRSTVAPESWRDAGGSIGSVSEINGILVITQTADNHRAIAHLLAQLRSAAK